jgi:hypothetical protein
MLWWTSLQQLESTHCGYELPSIVINPIAKLDCFLGGVFLVYSLTTLPVGHQAMRLSATPTGVLC